VLVAAHADARDWASYDDDLHRRRMTLRDVLAAQTRFVRGSLDDADALVARRARVDPSFVALVHRCKRDGIPVIVLSAGIQPLIERALAREGLDDVPVRANDVITSPDGWTMIFRDDSDNGHDKAAEVRALQQRGYRVIFIGDSHSDFDAALVADETYAKRGDPLERFLQQRHAKYTPFTSFEEIAL
jgi:HAD superfamily phosphoserine phosphatase-like hydrolase